MTGSVTDVSINGVSMPEAGLKGLIAGTYGLPGGSRRQLLAGTEPEAGA